MLFLGNSYTLQNALPAAVAAVFSAAGEDVAVDALATPGWRFVDHAGAIAEADPAYVAAFGASQGWVVLQEQSQIPGFPEGQTDLEASRAAASILDGHAAGTGGQTMFLMTWGRRDGDPTNAARYPDYVTMQEHLATGYLDYVARASADGTPAWVAPAGLAWARVYEHVVAEGGDPLAPGSAFHDLYVEDGSHPSPRGTYLTACVIYTSLTGESPEGLDAPADIPDAAFLQSVAAAVVLDHDGISYPWQADPGDTVADDTASDDTGTPDAPKADDPEATGACGCASGPGPAGWFALLLAAGVSLRRRVTGAA